MNLLNVCRSLFGERGRGRLWLACVLALGVVSEGSYAHAGTLTGTFQTPNGLPIKNGTITFTLSQAAFISGTGAVVPLTSSCYTSTDGTLHGLPNPLALPVGAVNSGSGTLPAGNYYVELAFYDASNNVTLVSPEQSFNAPLGGSLIIQPPVTFPPNASGMQVFIGTSSGSETLQGSTVGSIASFTQSTALTAGTAIPVANTTVCSIAFNDTMIPYVGYSVALISSSGKAYPGYPQLWQLNGGTSGTINISSGAPLWDGRVFYQQPILAQPLNHGPQSIAGPLSLGNYPLTAGLVYNVANGQQYASVQAAITASPTVFLPCGTYSGAIVITTPGVTLKGANRNCVFIVPPANTDAIQINATGAGVSGLNYVQLEDLTINCPAGTTGSGLAFVGGANQPNDWITVRNVTIGGQGVGCFNGIDIRGRTIWTRFDHVQVVYSTNNGLNVNTAAVVNTVDFDDTQFFNSQKYGVFWNQTGASNSQLISFEGSNIQNNQLASSQTANCAAAYFSGTNTLSFVATEFEANCPNANDGNAATILLTGTYNQAFSATNGNSFNDNKVNYDILDNSTQTSGLIAGNFFGNYLTNSIKIAAQNSSNITVGSNMGQSNVYVVDPNGNDHVQDTSEDKNAVIAVTSITSNNLPVSNSAYLELFNGPYTLNTATGYSSGQVVSLLARNGGNTTFTNGTGAGQWAALSGANLVLPQGRPMLWKVNSVGALQQLIPAYSYDLVDFASGATNGAIPIFNSGTGKYTPSAVAFSIRNGSWTITSATSTTVTFSPAFGTATGLACSLQGGSSMASTGVPWPSSLTTTGMTVNIPNSGTLSGTYICTLPNSN